ncbi:DUF3854 domain-containing protein [Tamlana sp. s12]|uniref:DUF5906 domain-containing protein n=1 Tax=Tamlana sp. s12 TaxID=1630406 RepID=UPI0007FE3AA4|nr:DUF5906 domain-containing protein [Tamlana sp. s12]OBQ52893.1 hypothetical protein VQ01_13170 [Tamlana sp. s12]QQY81080.1 DUF3854 domain-containing protein [Tamlana sp. s12]
MSYNSQTNSEKPHNQYLNERLKVLSISSKSNLFQSKTDKNIDEKVYFEADQFGNILINYFNLHGNRAQFRKKGNKWEERFVRTRLLQPKPDATGKINRYLSPKGSGLFPFFPPQILAKVVKKTKIETLVITEGEFKAFKGAMHGIDIIGIPSIHGFYDTIKHQNEKIKLLHFEIEQLIEICQVQNIVFLTDADTLTVKWEKNKDLKMRPLAFYSSVKNIRQALNPLLTTGKIKGVYFSHIQSSYNNVGKGLDDLLVRLKDKEKDIAADLLKLTKSRTYFSTQNITEHDYNRQLLTYFGLKSVKTFYDVYGDYIDEREFKYNNAIYYHNHEEIVFVYHNDVDDYMRVGGNWYKVIHQPNHLGELERDIVPYPKTEIVMDYGKFKGFLTGVKKYDAFTVYPNWTSEHVQEIHSSFNLYAPMAYEAKKGNWINTYNFLKHIFGGVSTIDFEKEIEHNTKGDQFSVFLDYLTIQHRKPMHMLPVPILVSKQQGTGKTTVLKWLAEVYKGNSVVLSDSQFQNNFNAHYISKFVIGIDEAIMGADNVEAKKNKERLKQLVTDNTAQLENKGVNLKKIPFYGKILMTSNDEDNLMKIDDEDTRFFIVKVPQIPTKMKDPDLFLKMKEEIPAVLHYLQNRKIYHKRSDRFWFATEDILTEHFHTLKEATKSPLEKAIEDTIKEMFFRFDNLDIITMHPEYLLEKINKSRSRKFQITQLKDKLKTVYKLETYKQNRFKVPIKWIKREVTNVEEIYFMDHRRRYNVYSKTDWLNEAELIPVEHKIF